MSKTSQTHPLRIDAVAVPGTAGMIGMTFCPGKVQKNAMSGSWTRDLNTDMQAIQSWGATALISLMERHEFDELSVAAMAKHIPDGMQHFILPMPDGGVPDCEWEDRWKEIGPHIRALLIWGKRVVIHCKGGLGRTGLLAARLLVEFGMPPEDAMRAVRKARIGTIENSQQEEYVRRLTPVENLPLTQPHHPVEPERLRRFRGCLLGGAVGDALGAPVEFMKLAEIRQKFGQEGIRNLAPAYGRVGAITDDTQMTLFTAEGMLRAYVRGSIRGICHPPSVVHHAYLRWLLTQGERTVAKNVGLGGWLFTHRELFSRRAPGNACLSALKNAARFGDAAKNDSKGCGGVMRIAPVGLLVAATGETAERAFDWGCEMAGLTHGHPTGQLPAGVLAVLIRELAEGADLNKALHAAKKLLRQHPHHKETLDAIEKAEQLASSVAPAEECLPLLGEGWIAEEALAVALFCSLRAKNLEDGVIMAVNITGDSDSTGAITGNILGTMLGVEQIPARWLDKLELREVITEIADDLASVKQWRISSGEYRRSPEEEAEENWWTTKYPGW